MRISVLCHPNPNPPNPLCHPNPTRIPEDELRQINARLEGLVAQRTASLRESEQQMRQAEKMAAIGSSYSGQAGMARSISAARRRVWRRDSVILR
jgi:hypothetical protein